MLRVGIAIIILFVLLTVGWITFYPPKQKFSQEQIDRHQKFHYPIIENQQIPAIPYLTLPFRKSDMATYDITEGWMYSKKEQEIHGREIHGGVDYSVPYGTTVVAPVDGYAMASYQTFWIKDTEGNKKIYQGKPIRLGAGYFIQIYVPTVKRFVLLAHLSEIDPKIPFSPPEKLEKEDEWQPTNDKLPVEEIAHHPKVISIKKGDVVGKVGYSGLAMGEFEEYSENEEKPRLLKQSDYQSWDEPHLHFEEYWRVQKDPGPKERIGLQVWQRDPYGIYATYEYYPTPNKKSVLGKDPLFLLDKQGNPQFARN